MHCRCVYAGLFKVHLRAPTAWPAALCERFALACIPQCLLLEPFHVAMLVLPPVVTGNEGVHVSTGYLCRCCSSSSRKYPTPPLALQTMQACSGASAMSATAM